MGLLPWSVSHNIVEHIKNLKFCFHKHLDAAVVQYVNMVKRGKIMVQSWARINHKRLMFQFVSSRSSLLARFYANFCRCARSDRYGELRLAHVSLPGVSSTKEKSFSCLQLLACGGFNCSTQKANCGLGLTGTTDKTFPHVANKLNHWEVSTASLDAMPCVRWNGEEKGKQNHEESEKLESAHWVLKSN